MPPSPASPPSLPANAAEADIAAQFVAASEQWKDCLRLAQLPETSPEWAAKCRAQAIGMMRQGQSALRLLLRMQETRRKLEADTAGCDRLAWTEHCAINLMAEALAAQPTEAKPSEAPAKAVAEPNQADPGSTPPASLSAGKSCPGEAPATPDFIRDGADLVAAAERYAAAYPERAARIRRTGKLPCDVRYFDPPEAALARALIAAQTPILAALDDLPMAPDVIRGNRLPDRALPEARAA